MIVPVRGLLLLGCGMVGILEGPGALRAVREGRAEPLPDRSSSMFVDAGAGSRHATGTTATVASLPVAGPSPRVALEVLRGDEPPLLDAGALSGRPTTQEVGGQ